MLNNVAHQINHAQSQDHYNFELTSTHIITDNNQVIKSYGIHIYNAKKYLLSNPNESCRIDDISIDREEVLNLIRLINDLDVSPIHLPEIIEDYLS